MKTQEGQFISQPEEPIIPREQGLQHETCKHTFSHQKRNGGNVSEKEKTSQWTNMYIHPIVLAHLYTPMTSPGGGGEKISTLKFTETPSYNTCQCNPSVKKHFYSSIRTHTFSDTQKPWQEVNLLFLPLWR